MVFSCGPCSALFLGMESPLPPFLQGRIYFRLTLDWGAPRVQICRNHQFGTHLKQIESLSWTPSLDHSLHLGSSKSWALLFISFFWVSTNWFSHQNFGEPCRFSLNLPLFGVEPSSKGHGSNLWNPSNRIALFHWTLERVSSSKLALRC